MHICVCMCICNVRVCVCVCVSMACAHTCVVMDVENVLVHYSLRKNENF